MAARSRQRDVNLSTAALEALREIWRWNADHYGPDHADGYVEYLNSALGALARPEIAGRPPLSAVSIYGTC